MSEWGAILDACLAHVESAVPGVTTARRLVALSRVPADKFPHCSAYILDTGAALIPSGYLQENREIAAQLLLRWKGETQENVYLAHDAIRTALYADRTLGGLVSRLYLSGATPLEDPESHVTSLALIVLCEKVA